MTDHLRETPEPRRRMGLVVILGVLLAAGLLGVWGWTRWRESRPARLSQELKQAALEGRWHDVGSLSARLIDLAPHDGEAWMLRARAAHADGHPVDSARYLSEMPSDSPQKLVALRQLAELQLGSLSDPLSAEQTYRQILEREPRSEVPHQRLIFFYAMTLQRQELVRQARHAMELGCEPIEAYVYLFFIDSLHFTNGVPVNRRWLSRNPSSELFTVAEAIHMASVLQGGAPRDDLEVVRRIRRMADEKEHVLGELFNRYPHNLELLAWHIERAIERGDVDRAVDLLARLPPEADGDNRIRRFAGWAHDQLGHHERALASYKEAIRLNPLDWNTRHLLAELRRQEQKFDEVERLEKLVDSANQLRRALDLLPDARSAPNDLLEKLADYAIQCGDAMYADSLRRRLDLTSGASGQNQ